VVLLEVVVQELVLVAVLAVAELLVVAVGLLDKAIVVDLAQEPTHKPRAVLEVVEVLVVEVALVVTPVLVVALELVQQTTLLVPPLPMLVEEAEEALAVITKVGFQTQLI
jgi:hypothetical protein